MEDFAYEEYDLINASYALPFVPSPRFTETMRRIITSLNPGGLLVCEFFGPQDSWNTPKSQMSFHTRANIEHLVKPLRIILLDEEQTRGRTASGEVKNWHIFHLIAFCDVAFTPNGTLAIP
jgi:tellurite methyltransferase